MTVKIQRKLKKLKISEIYLVDRSREKLKFKTVKI